jgi:hypothetical protein
LEEVEVFLLRIVGCVSPAKWDSEVCKSDAGFSDGSEINFLLSRDWICEKTVMQKVKNLANLLGFWEEMFPKPDKTLKKP